MSNVIIKPGREKSILNQHPWVFSGAILRVEGGAGPGDIVTVTDKAGNFLARGYWNAKSQIQVRILTWRDEAIDENWWRERLRSSIERRGYGLAGYREGAHAGGARLVNAENDFLPGLVVDYYAGWLVIQALALGIDRRKAEIVALLAELLAPHGIYERSDVDVRGKEGLKPATGTLWGEEPPEYIVLDEDYLVMHVDARKGHKTGHYLDQQENRVLLSGWVSAYYGRHDRPCDLLNLFSYTGSFGLGAASACTRVVNVDSSREALELAESSVELNRHARHSRFEFIQADVFEYLRDIAAEGQQYDVVILDPPKFAHNKQQVQKASRGYKDINLNAFKVVKPGGYLMTFSCSGAISRDLFQKIVFGALADSGRQAQIVRHLSAADDHPVALTFPEGEYLKGLLLRVE